jgi:hypothetical protein
MTDSAAHQVNQNRLRAARISAVVASVLSLAFDFARIGRTHLNDRMKTP